MLCCKLKSLSSRNSRLPQRTEIINLKERGRVEGGDGGGLAGVVGEGGEVGRRGCH